MDDRERMKQYSYKATSNLVLEQERSRRERNADTGEAASLKTDDLQGRMGDKAARRPGEKSAELTARLERKRKRDARASKAGSDVADDDIAGIGGMDGEGPPELQALVPNANVLDVADEFELSAEGGRYIPTTRVSKTAFEALLAFVMSKLGDQPRDLLRSAAEEALAILKDQRLQESERKKVVEELFAAKMSADEFSRLSLFGRQIKDFGTDAEKAELGNEVPQVEDLHEEQGLAVVFDDDDVDGRNLSDDGDIQEEVDMRDMMDEYGADFPTVAGPGGGIEDNEGLRSLPGMRQGGSSLPDGFEDGNHFSPLKVDGYWLQRNLSKFYKDADECHRKAEEVLDILSGKEDDRSCENKLVMLLEFDKFDFITLVIENRSAIVFCTRLARAEGPSERSQVESEMRNDENGLELLRLLGFEDKTGGQENGNASRSARSRERGAGQKDNSRRVRFAGETDDSTPRRGRKRVRLALRKLDLDSLSFQKGGHLMSVRDCKLPPGSERTETKDYDEWHIPAVRAVNTGNEKRLSIDSLAVWCQPAFQGTRCLNRMQSSVYPCAFNSDENMLLCAPTGAGKTNVAVLTILRAIRNSGSTDKEMSSMGEADLNAFKVVYVAPMKALVSEVVENLGKRLSSLGLLVRELTGDVNLSRQEIEETQVIVTTPEKWDIITRKSGERAYTSLVRLLIIDEIHLLHDERGPVLEAIVARTSRSVESLTATTRVVGLSATLPNYQDVATFLRVNPEKGLFYYDASHRPCPLQQCFVGITVKKAMKRFQLMNELTYEKVKEQVEGSNQVIVFVHSRKETSSTCQHLINKAIDEEIIDKFLRPGSTSSEIVREELSGVNSKDLRYLLEHGLATHHAGMTRSDRHLVEALFENRHIKVLVSTATLAWGINLPAHAVIIKGTRVYSPEHGRWVELSSMDVMQMMGRAGRPQYDNHGEGIIITTKADVLFYLSLLNQQLPIESQFVARLVDMLNAEVAMGSVSSIEEGALWLSYTYLYVRMLKNPTLYGISVDEHQVDPKLERRRCELVHAAASILHSSGLVKYEKRSGTISGTNLGRVAADFYVGHGTISMYVEHMRPTATDIDLFRLMSLSGEFRHIRVREEEKLELARLADRVPIPIKESLDESTAKVNVLLQSFISNLSLDGLALKADMVYVTQSAARLARALLQVAIQIKCASLVDRCLRLCKAVTSRQWTSQSPLRQFYDILGDEVLHKIERKDISFERYYDLTVAELSELLRSPKLGRTVHRLVHSLPRLELGAKVRPLSRSTLEIELTLSPDFRFDRKLHRSGEAFWIIVEDADSEILLHSEMFFLRSSLASEVHVLNFVVQLTSPQPPQYFVKCVSDRWIVPETVVPILFHRLLLPEKFAPHTKVLDMRPRAVEHAFQMDLSSAADSSILDVEAYREALEDLRTYFSRKSNHFTPLQTQLFPTLFESDENAVVATLPGIERMTCAELCLARLFSRKPTSVAVWIIGRGDVAVEGVQKLLASGIGGQLNLTVGTFLTDRSEDLNLLRTAGTIVLTTVERWDMFSRKRRQKREGKILRKLGLVLIDGVHMLSDQGGKGAALEIVGSRMRYFAAENGENAFRIVALSDPIANAKEVGHWLGAPPTAVFSFHPKAVDKAMRVEVVPASQRSGGIRYSPAAALIRPVYAAIRRHSGESTNSVLVFVPSRKMARSLALELVGAAAQGGSPERFLCDPESLIDSQVATLDPGTLRDCIVFGVGYIHQGMRETQKSCVESLFQVGTIQVLVATCDYAWQSTIIRPCLVVIAGTSREDEGGFAVRRAEYAQTDLLRMMCCMRNRAATEKRVVVVITETALHEHYKHRCMEPFPVESQLPETLSDHLNAEIAAGEVETKQDAVDYLTWTFFYRRLPKNPNYYGLKGLSHVEISNHLSEMVDTALSELEDSKCVAAEGEQDIALGALNLGIIAAHYYIRHATVELFASSMTPKTKLGGLLNILSLASEFGEVAVRIGEEEVLSKLSQDLPMSLDQAGSVSFSSPHVKAHILLQAQMNRLNIPIQLKQDQATILPTAVRLLRAMVDVISSAGWLKPALTAVELSQMLIQGLWVSDSPVMQLPYIDKSLAATLESEFDVSDIFEFLDMAPKDRSEVLRGLSNKQVLDIASACQEFPNLKNLEIHSIEEMHDHEGQSTTRVLVEIKRNDDDEDVEEEGLQGAGRKAVPIVAAPLYPEPKEEGWWVIIGDPQTNSLLTLKHVSLKKTAMVKLEFSSPSIQGKQNLQLSVLSDSYIDCDQEDVFSITVTEMRNIEEDRDENVAAEEPKQRPG